MPTFLSVSGLAGLTAGVLAAALADSFPLHRAALKNWGGGLLVASAALMGLVFPLI